MRAKDHPRVCGENPKRPERCNLRHGSPPRMRGKLDDIPAKQRERRITPAYAGKTEIGKALSYNCLGSPPRMRGKHGHLRRPRAAARITPAGAGKTCTKRQHGLLHRDHPRRCGENVDIVRFAVNGDGSPPQVRGKRFER